MNSGALIYADDLHKLSHHHISLLVNVHNNNQRSSSVAHNLAVRSVHKVVQMKSEKACMVSLFYVRSVGSNNSPTHPSYEQKVNKVLYRKWTNLKATVAIKWT